MIKCRCETCGFYYDSEKHSSCPHCAAAAAGKPLPKPADVPRAHKNRTVQPITMPEPALNEDAKSKKKEKRHKKEKKHFWKSKKKESVNYRQEDIVLKNAIPVVDDSPYKATTLQNDEDNASVAEKERNTLENALLAQKTQPTNQISNVQVTEKPQSGSLKDAVLQADSAQLSANVKTEARYHFSDTIEPVVGWLVCVNGKYKGESFNLKSGNNTIGRSLSMDIAFAKEGSVSRERHAFIVFEPNKKQFFIKSGESAGLTYLNDELVLNFSELHDGDLITLGTVNLVFLSFAGDHFSWEEYLVD